MAERTGLEPATPGVTGRYSNQLNYRSVEVVRILRQLFLLGKQKFNFFYTKIKCKKSLIKVQKKFVF